MKQSTTSARSGTEIQEGEMERMQEAIRKRSVKRRGKKESSGVREERREEKTVTGSWEC